MMLFCLFQLHDSFAAFRSQNLSLNVSFEVEADKLKVHNIWWTIKFLVTHIFYTFITFHYFSG